MSTTSAARRPAPATVSAARRWAMLAAGTGAQAATSAMVTAPSFLIPELHRPIAEGGYGMSLAEAGVVAAASMTGMMFTLVLWGLVVDRRGERFALLAGLLVTAVGGGVAAVLASPWPMAAALCFAGVGAAATNSASGRVVVGWFPPERRGIAMGIRQTGQPLGVGLAAGTVAVIAHHHGIGPALWVPTGAAVLMMGFVALVVLDPPRPAATGGVGTANPYRADSYLTRIHAASVLLVVPQFLVWTFGLTWLVDDLGWSPGVAGLVVAGTQAAGAAARIGAGWASDLVGSRMRPMRAVAFLAAATMALLGLAATGAAGSTPLTVLAVGLLVVASAVTVADNGLAFTAVAERAGPFWSGRALGLQNTAQHVAAVAVPPVAGLTIAAWGYGAAYALAAALPLLAVAVVPVAGERRIDS
ncbi:MFS transporter [Pimelobacter simplex]|uniref:MFS transporter n=1 Tax=Nocardioides simplex TaxID=2045 RepID=UPI00214FB8AD|nr:MFS transporter [Pimelobacter simplex]UUW91239.1 MFS transporter [Pimelobacter simplex]UUW95067.1 MFS transporter [Pimelobacter simplex]